MQMPLSWDLPSHRLMRETLANGVPGGKSLGSPELMELVSRKWVGEAHEYYDLLVGHARKLDIWESDKNDFRHSGYQIFHQVTNNKIFRDLYFLKLVLLCLLL